MPVDSRCNYSTVICVLLYVYFYLETYLLYLCQQAKIYLCFHGNDQVLLLIVICISVDSNLDKCCYSSIFAFCKCLRDLYCYLYKMEIH